MWLEARRHDLRGTLRLWRKGPLPTAAAVLTIALGAGLNIALFRIVWSVLLRPLPYPAPSQLVQVWSIGPHSQRRLPNGLLLENWRAASHSFESLAAYRPWRATVGTAGDADRAPAGLVSSEFFGLLGVRPHLGGLFTPAQALPGENDVVVLSHSYWKSRFGADPSWIGRSILVDDRLCRVAGVLPPDFRDAVTYGAVQPALYLPISKMAEGALRISSGYVLGRLKPGIPPDAAHSELSALSLPAPGEEKLGVAVLRLQDQIGREVRPALLALFAASACVLLIACTNVANLLLAQAVSRRPELAIRGALGAGRARLIGQLLTESLALSAAGGALGLASALAISRLLVALYPGSLPRIEEGGTALPLFGFALLVAVSSTALSGVLPAVLASRPAAGAGLRAGRSWMSRRSALWQDALIALQVAATVMVLIAAGLLLRTFASLRAVDLGFERARILTAQVVLPEARYPGEADWSRFASQWVERLRAIPGVEEAALTNSLPLAYNILVDISFYLPQQDTEALAGGRAVTGDYFHLLGLRMAEGRPLTASDENRPDVIVVNQSFARRFLKGAPATGSIIRFGPRRPAAIVGVVKDLRNLGFGRVPQPEIYMPYSQLPANYQDVLVRSSLPLEQFASAARSQLRALDSHLALTQLSTMDRILDGEMAPPRFHATLLGLFAAVALLLAAVGVYAVIAQGVKTRTAEFGIRSALGAAPGNLFCLVARQGLRAPLAGLAAGLASAYAGARLLESLLYGIRPHDPAVFLGAAAFVALTCLLACGLPARHAARTSPSLALRNE